MCSDIIRASRNINDRSDLFDPRPTVPGPLNKHARRFSCVTLRPFHASDQRAPTAFDVGRKLTLRACIVFRCEIFFNFNAGTEASQGTPSILCTHHRHSDLSACFLALGAAGRQRSSQRSRLFSSPASRICPRLTHSSIRFSVPINTCVTSTSTTVPYL